jgi:hypothetical protein
MEKKTEDGRKIVSLAAWNMVCKPKDNGGLGVLNMKIQNPALLLKYLDKFYNRKDLQTCVAEKSICRGIASCSIGQGTSVIRVLCKKPSLVYFLTHKIRISLLQAYKSRL